MKSIIIFIVLALANCKLLKVVELFRHGARGALSSYWDGLNQSYISGELTPTGMR